jgi:8-oxo-dGTP pyrophosphatase MutT (NUDIX family)
MDIRDDYTHPDVFTLGPAEGWAESESDPTRIDWPTRQARALIGFQVVNGRPCNPCEPTAVRHGRNLMGFWGENAMADALVTATHGGHRWLLMIQRTDRTGWAVPGGHIEPGELPATAALRELTEETGLTVEHGVPGAARYVPDPRSSYEAWAVTVPVTIDLGEVADLPAVQGDDDAARAVWVPADTYDMVRTDLWLRFSGLVFAAHRAMLRDYLG